MNDISKPYVSIVSGTYNRLRFLKQMVESVRKSIGIGIPYEIVLVDGGSTDGSIEYMRSQSDIVLVEQGKLLGAVKAFHAGFEVAKGKYVVVANDDIAFKYESLRNAISVMDDDPYIGIGCFPQNRYSSDYTVGMQPAVRDGKQVSVPYGQVCIIPKWLGDKVGWWDPGVGYHTYAGDTEMSCNVYELGLKIIELESCCIDDFVVKDTLREINHESVVNNIHPDSQKWRLKWTRNGKLGPIISNFPLIDVASRRVPRMVYAPLFDTQNVEIQKFTKKGLRESLSKHFLVSEIDYRRNVDDLYYAISMFNPDIVLIQLQDSKLIPYDLMKKMTMDFPKVAFVSWNGDYNHRVLQSEDYKSIMKLFDLATFVCTDISDSYTYEGIEYEYWQIGFETYEELKADSESIDVVFQANCYTSARQQIGQMLRYHKDWKTKLMGSWPSNIKSDGNTLYDFAAGDALYRSAKISISDNGFPQSYGYVSNRLFQALHAGAFVLQQEIPGMKELLGFENGVHVVVWRDIQELEFLISEWIPKYSERRMISQEGKRFVDRNHSFDVRVDELMNMLQARGLYSTNR